MPYNPEWWLAEAWRRMASSDYTWTVASNDTARRQWADSAARRWSASARMPRQRQATLHPNDRPLGRKIRVITDLGGPNERESISYMSPVTFCRTCPPPPRDARETGHARYVVDVDNYASFDNPLITGDALEREEINRYVPFPLSTANATLPWSCDIYTVTATCYAFAVKYCTGGGGGQGLSTMAAYLAIRYIFQFIIDAWNGRQQALADFAPLVPTNDVCVRTFCRIESADTWATICAYVPKLIRCCMALDSSDEVDDDDDEESIEIRNTLLFFRNVRQLIIAYQTNVMRPIPRKCSAGASALRLVRVQRVHNDVSLADELEKLQMGTEAAAVRSMHIQCPDVQIASVHFVESHDVHACDVEATMRTFRDVHKCIRYPYMVVTMPSDSQEFNRIVLVIADVDYQAIFDRRLLRASITYGPTHGVCRESPFPIYPIVINRLVYGTPTQRLGALETIQRLVGINGDVMRTFDPMASLPPETEPDILCRVSDALLDAVELFKTPKMICKNFYPIAGMIMSIIQCRVPHYFTASGRKAAIRIFALEHNRCEHVGIAVDKYAAKWLAMLRDAQPLRASHKEDIEEAIYSFPAIVPNDAGKLDMMSSVIYYLTLIHQLAAENRGGDDDGIAYWERLALMGFVTSRSIDRFGVPKPIISDEVRREKMTPASRKRSIANAQGEYRLHAGSWGGLRRRKRKRGDDERRTTILGVDINTHASAMRENTLWLNNVPSIARERRKTDWDYEEGNMLAFFLLMCERFKYMSLEERWKHITDPDHFVSVYTCHLVRMSRYMSRESEMPFMCDGTDVVYMADIFPLFHVYSMYGERRPFSNAERGMLDVLLCSPMDNNL